MGEIRHRMEELKAMEQDMIRVRLKLIGRIEDIKKGKNNV
jgi:hypothetical protein